MTTAPATAARPSLQYTGHPLVDIGAAAIAAFFGVTDPEQVTPEQIDRMAEWLEELYHQPFMGSYLTCIFPNSGYVNATSGPAKKQLFATQHLRSHKLESEELGQCALCGRDAALLAYRQHVPLITGEDVINFFPGGRAGLALCPGCMLSIAMSPLGCMRSEGRALAVHSLEPSLTFQFARRHLEGNRAFISLARSSGEKLPNRGGPRTRLIEELTEILRTSQLASEDGRPLHVTAYHLSNSGQGPSLDIHHLPSQVVNFMREAEGAAHQQAWKALIGAAWFESGKPKAGDEPLRRNYLFEDLFQLPQGWPRFFRLYFLGRRTRDIRPFDGRSSWHSLDRLNLFNWPLAALFLRRIASMNEDRVEAIRRVGDRIAQFISGHDRFWAQIVMARSYHDFRYRLMRASEAEVKADRPPLITFEEFVLIFEPPPGDYGGGWRLGRDLLLFRIIDQMNAARLFEDEAIRNVTLPEDEEAES